MFNRTKMSLYASGFPASLRISADSLEMGTTNALVGIAFAFPAE